MNDAVDVRGAVSQAAECDWPTTNCYVDLWMLILRAWGMEPLAGLGVTVAQDYEGDQFTFFKYQHADLEKLFGVTVGELSIWHALEVQLAAQVHLDRLVLVEVDGYYLPDTRATSYRNQHTKTTIGIDSMDLAARKLTYFHNVGHYDLTDEDYDGVFRRLPQQDVADDVLPPYVEFARRRWPPLQGDALRQAAVEILRERLKRRPEENPIRLYRGDFPAQMEWLMAHSDRFHDYAFGVFRQLGANFQLLAGHLQWLTDGGTIGLAQATQAAAAISSTAKALQFKVARIASRRRFDACDHLFESLESNYDTVIRNLQHALG